jgi:hypothetical protein
MVAVITNEQVARHIQGNSTGTREKSDRGWSTITSISAFPRTSIRRDDTSALGHKTNGIPDGVRNEQVARAIQDYSKRVIKSATGG